MDKLTWLETIEAEEQEKLRAKKQARLQKHQRLKRLWYLPIIFERIALLGVIAFMYFLVYSAGFVTGVAQDKTELHCWREVKAKNITPVFTCEKTLPRTGAH
jgi:hypothetical protein